MKPRYIDANLAKEALLGWDTDPTDEEIEYAIDEIPTADVEKVKYGKWKPTNIPSYFGGVIYRCSLCDAIDGDHSKILGKYCWKCGARMDEGSGK